MDDQQPRSKILYLFLVIALLIALLSATLMKAGLSYFIIFGCAGVCAFLAWLRTSVSNL